VSAEIEVCLKLNQLEEKNNKKPKKIDVKEVVIKSILTYEV